MDALRTAQRELRRTVVVVTHDPRVAASADEAVELRDGRVASAVEMRGRRRRSGGSGPVVDWRGRDQ
jgi:ABC-type lipoprotein export system ATPase subunit